jgi:hypothetical protein
MFRSRWLAPVTCVILIALVTFHWLSPFHPRLHKAEMSFGAFQFEVHGRVSSATSDAFIERAAPFLHHGSAIACQHIQSSSWHSFPTGAATYVAGMPADTAMLT